MRRNYWSCGKFADWLRGTTKPKAETGPGWDNWHKQAKVSHPIRYWIVEEGLDYIQNFIWWPIDKIYDVKYYINNRWVTQTHCLTAHPKDIKPGHWQDVGYRFLPCLFNELVNYVEMELAWWHVVWDKEARKKYNTPWWGHGWFRWRVWSCPQAGIDNLKWQMSLVRDEEWLDKDDPDFGKPTYQAENAKEVYELYMWWKEVYPNRPDPHEASGWTKYCEEQREKTGRSFWLSAAEKTEEDEKRASSILDKCREIEEAYDKEDEEMLIRLIKVRKSLWT